MPKDRYANMNPLWRLPEFQQLDKQMLQNLDFFTLKMQLSQDYSSKLR